MSIHSKPADFAEVPEPQAVPSLFQRIMQKPPTAASLRRPLMVGGVLLVILVSAYFWITGGRFVSTDNAYVRAPKLMVSTDISGLVADVMVQEGQVVKKGDVLFTVDDRAFRIAVDNAKAQLEQTALNLASMQQDYRRLISDGAAQEAQVKLAQATYDRAAALLKTGAGTAATYDQARFALTSAQNQQQSLQEQAKVLLSKLGGDANADIKLHPSYLQAKAVLDEAQRQLDHTIIRAPFNGIVTQVDHLQPGTFLVAATASLTNTGAVALVGTDEVWVDANFKETDLTYAKSGDRAEVTVDAYPGRTFVGHIASIAPASGAEFSILPAQNASGNWVKIVQRIPVRIDLDKTSGSPRLRAGMSVYATVDTGHRRTLSELW